MSPLYSHSLAPQLLHAVVQELDDKIRKRGDLSLATAEEQHHWLHELTKFDLGRYLIVHRGLNGFWTYHLNTVLPHIPNRLRDQQYRQSPLAKFLYEESPNAQARQQRFQYVLQLNQMLLQDNAILASVPCGFMADLLHLDIEPYQGIQLYGIDYDTASLQGAIWLAEQRGVTRLFKPLFLDAWKLPFQNLFSLLSTHGLNMYVEDPQQLFNLYQTFYQAIRPAGHLVTSFLTPSPGKSTPTEWALDRLDPDAVRLQQLIFHEILGIKFKVQCRSQDMIDMLTEIGFIDIAIIYDTGSVFPTLLAKKP